MLCSADAMMPEARAVDSEEDKRFFNLPIDPQRLAPTRSAEVLKEEALRLFSEYTITDRHRPAEAHQLLELRKQPFRSNKQTPLP